MLDRLTGLLWFIRFHRLLRIARRRQARPHRGALPRERAAGGDDAHTPWHRAAHAANGQRRHGVLRHDAAHQHHRHVRQPSLALGAEGPTSGCGRETRCKTHLARCGRSDAKGERAATVTMRPLRDRYATVTRPLRDRCATEGGDTLARHWRALTRAAGRAPGEQGH